MPKMKTWDGSQWVELNANTKIQKGGTAIGNRGGINFIEGTGITMTVADDGANDRVNVTINSSGGSGIQDIGVIPTTGWVSNTGDYAYRVDIPVTGITSANLVTLFMDKEYVDVANIAKICPTVETFDGIIRVFAQNIPVDNIPFTWSSGSVGSKGYTGSQGIQGYTGSQGIQGYTGSQGAGMQSIAGGTTGQVLTKSSDSDYAYTWSTPVLDYNSLSSRPIINGQLQAITKAYSNTNYSTKQLRNIIIATTDADLASMENGDIWIKV
jgi:hypothetical protein